MTGACRGGPGKLRSGKCRNTPIGREGAGRASFQVNVKERPGERTNLKLSRETAEEALSAGAVTPGKWSPTQNPGGHRSPQRPQRRQLGPHKEPHVHETTEPGSPRGTSEQMAIWGKEDAQEGGSYRETRER